MPLRLFQLCSLLIVLAGCERSAPLSPSPGGAAGGPSRSEPLLSSPVSFEDVAERSGIRFVHLCGGNPSAKDYIIEVNGGGCALLDYDGDGDLDIFLVNGAPIESLQGPAATGSTPGAGSTAATASTPAPPSDALFRNDGNWKFTDVTGAMGLRESDWGCGCAAADYDNDGDPDIFVANYGPDRLWRNDGPGGFKDVTREAGVGDPGWGSSCAWVDYDRDGRLDLFVVNYLRFEISKVKKRGTDPSCQYKGMPILCGPIGLPPAHCTLYHNRGDGTFEDASVKSRIRSVAPSYGLGVVVLDYNRDDWPDIYVTNDTRPNLLFKNLGDGTFAEVAMQAGAALNDQALAQAGMGVDATFRGGNGFEDLLVVNFEDDTCTYRRNEGNGFFTEVTGPVGLASPTFKYLKWGCFFFDADLDGREDVFISHGHVVPEADRAPSSPGYRQANKLFLDDGAGKFIDVSAKAGPAFQIKKSHRGAAHGDLDGDGDDDLVVSAVDDQISVYENQGPPKGHWLAVRTEGTVSNRDGIGAVVSLKAGGRIQMRRIRSGSSYASSSELAARFGLGPLAAVEDLRVRWPTGKEETFVVPGVDRVMRVREGDGK